MSDIYTVRIDGVEYDIKGNRPPTEAEARAAIGRQPMFTAEEDTTPFPTWSERAHLTGLPAQVTDFAEGVVSAVPNAVFKGGDALRRAAPAWMGYGSNRPMDNPAVQRGMQAPQSTAGQVGAWAPLVAPLAYGGWVAPARTALGLGGGALTAAVATPVAESIAEGLGATEDQQRAYGEIGGTLAGLKGGTAAYKSRYGPAVTRGVSNVGNRVRETAASAREDGVGGAIAAAARVSLGTDPVKLLVQAGKPNTRLTYFEKNLDDVLGYVHKWATDNKLTITNNRDLLKGLNAAQKDIWAQRSAMLPDAETRTSGEAVADAMVNSIQTYDVVKNPGIAKATAKFANRFRRSFTLQEAESMLKSVNAELQSYFGQFPAARRTDLQANPKTRILEAQRVELQNMVYGILEDPAQSAGVRELSRRYGAAMEAKQVFTARQNVYARQQPFSLNEQIAQTNAAGELAGAARKAIMGDLGGASVDVASAYAKRDTSRFLKEMQGLDKLIERAMASYAKTPGAGPKPLPTGPVKPKAPPKPVSAAASPWTQRSGTATLPRPTPDMTGTPVGVGKQFTAGPFKFQTWAVIDGVVRRVK